MHFNIISVAFFAALASAAHQHPQYFHHRRHFNTSSSAADELTTLTVSVTQLRTVTSCAHTITSCPAESATHVSVVTDTIVLTTTICPITAAEAVKSSAIAAAGGTYTKAAVMPLSTGVASGGSGAGGTTAADSAVPTTAGSESSSTSTTTIKSTETYTQRIVSGSCLNVKSILIGDLRRCMRPVHQLQERQDLRRRKNIVRRLFQGAPRRSHSRWRND